MYSKKLNILFLSIPFSAASLLSGCMTSNAYTDQQQLSDTTVGSGVGVVSGALAGAVLGGERGAYIGGALGGIAGAGVGHHLDNEHAELRQRLLNTGVRVQQVGNSIQLIMASDVTFETNQAAIRSNFYSVLNSVAEVLKKYKQTSVIVSGYTDNTGSAAHNQVLSEQRAQSVVDYFIGQNVNPNRLFARGFGLRDPLASNATAVGRTMNRRVEITLRSLEQQ